MVAAYNILSRQSKTVRRKHSGFAKILLKDAFSFCLLMIYMEKKILHVRLHIHVHYSWLLSQIPISLVLSCEIQMVRLV